MWKVVGKHAAVSFGAGAGKAAMDHTVKHLFGLGAKGRRQRALRAPRRGRGSPLTGFAVAEELLAQTKPRRRLGESPQQYALRHLHAAEQEAHDSMSERRGYSHFTDKELRAADRELERRIAKIKKHMGSSARGRRAKGLRAPQGRRAVEPTIKSAKWKKTKDFWDDGTYTVTITGTDGHRPGITTITARQIFYDGGVWQQTLRRGTLKLGRNKKEAEKFLLWYRGAKTADKKLWGGSGYLGDASEAFGWNYTDNRPEGGWDHSGAARGRRARPPIATFYDPASHRTAFAYSDGDIAFGTGSPKSFVPVGRVRAKRPERQHKLMVGWVYRNEDPRKKQRGRKGRRANMTRESVYAEGYAKGRGVGAQDKKFGARFDDKGSTIYRGGWQKSAYLAGWGDGYRDGFHGGKWHKKTAYRRR